MEAINLESGGGFGVSGERSEQTILWMDERCPEPAGKDAYPRGRKSFGNKFWGLPRSVASGSCRIPVSCVECHPSDREPPRVRVAPGRGPMAPWPVSPCDRETGAGFFRSFGGMGRGGSGSEGRQKKWIKNHMFWKFSGLRSSVEPERARGPPDGHNNLTKGQREEKTNNGGDKKWEDGKETAEEGSQRERRGTHHAEGSLRLERVVVRIEVPRHRQRRDAARTPPRPPARERIGGLALPRRSLTTDHRWKRAEGHFQLSW